jgi:hypothetical protein
MTTTIEAYTDAGKPLAIPLDTILTVEPHHAPYDAYRLVYRRGAKGRPRWALAYGATLATAYAPGLPPRCDAAAAAGDPPRWPFERATAPMPDPLRWPTPPARTRRDYQRTRRAGIRERAWASLQGGHKPPRITSDPEGYRAFMVAKRAAERGQRRDTEIGRAVGLAGAAAGIT